MESIHIRHLILIPVNVNAQNLWKRFGDEMNLLGLLYRALAIEVADRYSLLVQQLLADAH